MQRFEPPPLPGSTGGQEPHDPYAPRDPYAPHDPYASPVAGPVHAQVGHPAQAWQTSATVNHPQGTTVLVLGILSVCGLAILGPVAWVMGARALKEVDRAGVPVANRGQLLAGQITGIIGTAFLALGLLYAAVTLAFILSGSA